MTVENELQINPQRVYSPSFVAQHLLHHITCLHLAKAGAAILRNISPAPSVRIFPNDSPCHSQPANAPNTTLISRNARAKNLRNA
jgi:hypothetical protein